MKRLNKTLLALFVCVSIVLTALAVPAFAAGTSLKAGVANIVVADGTITASAVFSNISGSAAATGKLILAQYVGGVLKSAAAADVTVAAKTENSAQVTADEVSDATVKCFLVEANNITPLAVTATKGANSPALSDILINGKSIGEVDSNQAFSADKNSYSIELSDDLVMPVVKGVVAEADNTYYAVTSYSYGADYQTATAAVTVKSTTGAASYTYTVNFSIARETVNPHVIKGAASDADFEAVSDTTFGEEYRSKNKVATTIYSGSTDATIGYLNTNLHTFTGTGGSALTAIPEGATASKIYANMPFRDWIVYKVNSEVLKGADYFALRTNGSSAKFADVLYDGTNTISTLADGTGLISFELAADANVHIITTKPVSDYVNKDHYTEIVNFSGHIVGAQPGNNNWGNDRNFDYMYTKKFSAGDTVTIPYRAAIANSRTPLIAVTPVKEEKTITPLVGELELKIPNTDGSKDGVFDTISYDEYAAYYKTVTGSDPVIDGTLNDKETEYKQEMIQANNQFGVIGEGEYIYTQTNRVFNGLNPVYGLEGCLFIKPNVLHAQQPRFWIMAALAGKKDVAAAKAETSGAYYDFSAGGAIPWYSFKVNRDCDVIVFTNLYEVTGYKNEGYEKVNLNADAFKNLKNGTVAGTYRSAQIKSYNAGDTVTVYNCANEQNYTAGSLAEVLPIMVVRFK